MKKMKLNVDISKAQGKYRAAEIEPKRNRPRVTLQRPYFDVTKSQAVDRTIILMAPSLTRPRARCAMPSKRSMLRASSQFRAASTIS